MLLSDFISLNDNMTIVILVSLVTILILGISYYFKDDILSQLGKEQILFGLVTKGQKAIVEDLQQQNTKAKLSMLESLKPYMNRFNIGMFIVVSSLILVGFTFFDAIRKSLSDLFYGQNTSPSSKTTTSSV